MKELMAGEESERPILESFMDKQDDLSSNHIGNDNNNGSKRYQTILGPGTDGLNRIERQLKTAYEEEEFAKKTKGLPTCHFLLGFCTTLSMVLLLAWRIAFSEGFMANSRQAIINWHIMFTSLAFLVLFTTSLASYRVYRNPNMSTIQQIHYLVSLLTLLFMALDWGITTNATEHSDLYGIHVWIGSITQLLFFIQWVASFLIYLFPRLSRKKRENHKRYHKWVGLLIFVLALLAILTGIEQLSCQMETSTGEPILVNFLMLCILGVGISLMYLITKPEWARVEICEDITKSAVPSLDNSSENDEN